MAVHGTSPTPLTGGAKRVRGACETGFLEVHSTNKAQGVLTFSPKRPNVDNHPAHALGLSGRTQPRTVATGGADGRGLPDGPGSRRPARPPLLNARTTDTRCPRCAPSARRSSDCHPDRRRFRGFSAQFPLHVVAPCRASPLLSTAFVCPVTKHEPCPLRPRSQLLASCSRNSCLPALTSGEFHISNFVSRITAHYLLRIPECTAVAPVSKCPTGSRCHPGSVLRPSPSVRRPEAGSGERAWTPHLRPRGQSLLPQTPFLWSERSP